MRGKYTPADGVQSRGVSTTTRSGDRGAGESDWGVGRGGGGGGGVEGGKRNMTRGGGSTGELM